MTANQVNQLDKNKHLQNNAPDITLFNSHIQGFTCTPDTKS